MLIKRQCQFVCFNFCQFFWTAIYIIWKLDIKLNTSSVWLFWGSKFFTSLHSATFVFSISTRQDMVHRHKKSIRMSWNRASCRDLLQEGVHCHFCRFKWFKSYGYNEVLALSVSTYKFCWAIVGIVVPGSTSLLLSILKINYDERSRNPNQWYLVSSSSSSTYFRFRSDHCLWSSFHLFQNSLHTIANLGLSWHGVSSLPCWKCCIYCNNELPQQWPVAFSLLESRSNLSVSVTIDQVATNEISEEAAFPRFQAFWKCFSVLVLRMLPDVFDCLQNCYLCSE